MDKAMQQTFPIFPSPTQTYNIFCFPILFQTFKVSAEQQQDDAEIYSCG